MKNMIGAGILVIVGLTAWMLWTVRASSSHPVDVDLNLSGGGSQCSPSKPGRVTVRKGDTIRWNFQNHCSVKGKILEQWVDIVDRWPQHPNNANDKEDPLENCDPRVKVGSTQRSLKCDVKKPNYVTGRVYLYRIKVDPVSSAGDAGSGTDPEIDVQPPNLEGQGSPTPSPTPTPSATPTPPPD